MAEDDVLTKAVGLLWHTLWRLWIFLCRLILAQKVLQDKPFITFFGSLPKWQGIREACLPDHQYKIATAPTPALPPLFPLLGFPCSFFFFLFLFCIRTYSQQQQKYSLVYCLCPLLEQRTQTICFVHSCIPGVWTSEPRTFYSEMTTLLRS